MARVTLASLKTEVENYKKLLSDRDEEIVKLEAKIDLIINSKIDETLSDCVPSSSLSNLKERLANKDNEVQELKSINNRLESEKVALELKLRTFSDVDEIKHQYHRATIEIIELRNETIVKESQLTELTTRISELQITLENKAIEVKEARAHCLIENNTLKNENRSLVDSLKSKQDVMETLDSSNRKLYSQLNGVNINFKLMCIVAAVEFLSILTYIVLF